jgi:hypothetical protein
MTEQKTVAPPIPISGWIEAGIYVVSIGVLGLIYAIGHQIGAHPIAFILYAMVVSAAMLLAATGFGPDAKRIIMAPQSWLVGAATVGLEIFYYLTLTHITPTTGSLLVRIAIPLAMVIGWVLFSRRPSRLAMAGGLTILVGVVPLALTVPADLRTPVFSAVTAAALTFILRSFSSEFHPWNRRANTVMEKLRVTGLVVLVTCIVGLALAGIGSAAVGIGLLPPLAVIPTPEQMLHVPTILLGTLVGSVVITSIVVFSFSAVVKIRTENLTAASAFTPLTTLVAQMAGSAVGLIPTYALEPELLPSMVIVIGGVFLILYAAGRR